MGYLWFTNSLGSRHLKIGATIGFIVVLLTAMVIITANAVILITEKAPSIVKWATNRQREHALGKWKSGIRVLPYQNRRFVKS
jgi:hypothetical protein